MHVLLAEDDPALGRALQVGLANEGIIVDWARDGIDAYSEFKKRHYDALVLDLSLPGIDGFDLLHRIRQDHSLVPIVIVSARSAVDDRIKGLDHGADDYLSKPFELAELLARLRAVARRAGEEPGFVIRIDEVEIDLRNQRVRSNGEAVALTPREFAVLRLLVEAPGTVSKARINALLGNESATQGDLAVVCVHSLRKKLGRDLIRTYRGWGYRISN